MSKTKDTLPENVNDNVTEQNQELESTKQNTIVEENTETEKSAAEEVLEVGERILGDTPIEEAEGR